MQIKFDDISVPTEKLNQVVAQNLYDIKIQYKKRRQRNHLFRGMAAAAILFAAGVCFTNPALAAKLPLIGHIFEKVQDEMMFPGDFDEVAEPVTEGNVSESQGVTITLSEIYCDPRAMQVSAVIETKEPFPDKVKESNILYGDDIGYRMELDVEQDFDFMTPSGSEDEWEWTPVEMRGEYVDEHTFVGAIYIPFWVSPIARYTVPDTFQWKLKVSGIRNQYYSKAGTWEFKTDVTVDRSQMKVVEVNKSAPNGEIIKSVTMTPTEVYVDTVHDDSRESGSYEELQSVMLDADGRHIIDKVWTFSAEQYNVSKITIYYFRAETDEAYMEIQEKLNDESFQDQLVEYLEEISVEKIEIDLSDV